MRSAVSNPALLLWAALVACGGSANAPNDNAASTASRPSVNHSVCGTSTTVATGAQSPPAPGLQVPPGFAIETIAAIHKTRELASLPNGDLLVGTTGSDIYIVPNAEGQPGTPQVFATIDDNKAAGVAFAEVRCEVYVGSEYHVWAIPYDAGERKAPQITRIADVRSGMIAPGSDGDVHTTTSVAYAEGLVYAAAGSSCDSRMDHGKKPCTEIDPTRAAISVMNPDGSNFMQRAKRIRNPIAVARNPKTGSVWVGGAGQDHLPVGHPYEYLDDLTAHPGDADYGWPECEENHHVYVRGSDCSTTVEPLVELPAYSTIIGAAFYPMHLVGAYEFSSTYRGGLFATAHGSWHTKNGCSAEPPRVVFVAMNGDTPRKPVDWNDPTTQWTDFVTGFQTGCLTRIGRPTGIAVGVQGSLFIGDGDAGLVYRVRPTH